MIFKPEWFFFLLLRINKLTEANYMDHQLPTKEESTHLDHTVSNKVCFCVQWALLSVNSGHMPSSALMCLVSILVPSLQLSLLIASARLCFKPLIRLSMYSLQSRREVLPVLLNSVPCLPAFFVLCFVDVLPGFDRRLSHCSLQKSFRCTVPFVSGGHGFVMISEQFSFSSLVITENCWLHL